MVRVCGWVAGLFVATCATVCVGQGRRDTEAMEDSIGAAPAVEVAGGKVRGAVVEGGVHIYRGIPFAAAPIGELRWKPPQPVVPWAGVRECVKFGAACPQPPAAMGRAVPNQNEDCLFLNVWTPAERTGPLPVMLWIHGGGHTTGSGARGMYDGRHLAGRGVVVVTVNYRLGPFGFFAHSLLGAESGDGISGNYGLMDQIASLTWVRDHIARFGGDPKCVTIFGESAGSAAVSRLMVCPQAAGLFHRAIAESGGARGHNRHLKERWYGMESMEEIGLTIEKRLGADKETDRLAAMRKVPADKLLDASTPIVGLFGKGIKFSEIVDGRYIPDDPERLWEQGKQYDLPFMAGFNADEGTVFREQFPVRRATGYQMAIRRLYGPDAEKVLAAFPAANDDAVPGALNRLLTVSSFGAPARFLATAMEKKRSPGYLYHFTRTPPAAKKRGSGAFHGAEIFYVFESPQTLAFEPADTKLAATMAAAWVRFATTGDPNGADLPAWKPQRTAGDQLMIFGDKVEFARNPLCDQCDVMDELAARARANPAAVKPREMSDPEPHGGEAGGGRPRLRDRR